MINTNYIRHMHITNIIDIHIMTGSRRCTNAQIEGMLSSGLESRTQNCNFTCDILILTFSFASPPPLFSLSFSYIRLSIASFLSSFFVSFYYFSLHLGLSILSFSVPPFLFPISCFFIFCLCFYFFHFVLLWPLFYPFTLHCSLYLFFSVFDSSSFLHFSPFLCISLIVFVSLLLLLLFFI